jgi:hypothetical protein
MPSSMGVTHVSTNIKIKKIFFFPLMIPIEYLKKKEKKKGVGHFKKKNVFGSMHSIYFLMFHHLWRINSTW